MKKLKVIIVILIVLCIGLGIGCVLLNKNDKNSVTSNSNGNKLKELPLPEVTGGSRGELGIDKNINESTIDEYLGREDSVYRDMRMLEDPANYEAINGDRYLSGYVKGFEVVPLPYLIPVSGLPDEVGKTYVGNTLFSYVDDKFVANYEESMSIIEELFPKDKVIFLMCGGGGYAGMTKNFLVQLGWDETKIYNVGGYWYYKGKNNVEVKKVIDGKVTYDFDSVPYHKIEFDKLTKIEKENTNIAVTDIKISTSKQTIEEGNSYKLSAIVLPNEATNKKYKWVSSNEAVATVSQDGLVSAKKSGIVKISAITEDGNKSVSCTITVTEKENSNIIKLSNISEERKKFDAISSRTLSAEFSSKTRDKDGNLKVSEEVYLKEVDLYHEKLDNAVSEKTKIIDSLFDNKKSFIVLMVTSDCATFGFRKIDSAEKILNNNNIDYIYILYPEYDGVMKSKLYSKDMESITIVKDGKIFAVADEDKYSFNNDDDVKKWLSKYIAIK